jgi:signal transduction histidine kinase
MKSGAGDYVSKKALPPQRLGWTVKHLVRAHRAERDGRHAARALARYSEQLRMLAKAAMDINATLSIEEITRKAADRAREIIGARVAIVRTLPLGRTPASYLVCSSLPGDEERARALADTVDGDVGDGGKGGTRPGWLSSPLTGGRGERLGAIHVAEKLDGDFTEADDAILVQLAQMGSVAIANALLLAVEQAATRSRDDLIAIVSHDLRNPLSTIAMGAALLLAEKNERNAKVVPRIQRAAKRMETLLADLLDMTRIEAKILAVEPTPARLESLVDEAIDPLAPLAANKGVTLTTQMPQGLPRVRADRHRILQVLGNVVGNAVKFTDAGGHITVSAARDADTVHVSVVDTGKGIAADHLARLFERYWQAGDTANQGTGLGLFIAKGIVEAHGGRIWAQSEAGRGTTMTFTLQVARDGA